MMEMAPENFELAGSDGYIFLEDPPATVKAGSQQL
jgi:hypothetical protein